MQSLPNFDEAPGRKITRAFGPDQGYKTETLLGVIEDLQASDFYLKQVIKEMSSDISKFKDQIKTL